MSYSDQHQPPPLPQGGSGHQPPPPHYAPPPPPYCPPPRPSAGGTFFQTFLAAGCATILAPVLLIGGFFIVMFLLLSSGLEGAKKDGSFASLMQGQSGSSGLKVRVLRPGQPGSGTIAVVSIDGAISGNGSPLQGEGSMAFISEQLREARENPAVMAVILQIDSPGGGLTASDLLHHEVELFKESGKPVLAWAGSMMASGGYYIAVAADNIMASPTATVGSIGVILQHFQVSEMMEKLGIKVNPVTSGQRKDLGSPFRDMKPEERQLLQDYIDNAHKRFVDIVAKGRNMPTEQVAAFADGGIMDANTALEKGLVDSIGYIQDAIAWVEEKTDEEDMRVIGYRRQISLGELFNEAGAGAATAALEAASAADRAPRAMAVYEGAGR